MKGYELTKQDNELARHVPVQLRRCLKCDWWMRSIGPDHRICNTCRPATSLLYARAGSRIKPATRTEPAVL